MYFNVYVCGYNKNKLTVKTAFLSHLTPCTEAMFNSALKTALLLLLSQLILGETAKNVVKHSFSRNLKLIIFNERLRIK